MTISTRSRRRTSAMASETFMLPPHVVTRGLDPRVHLLCVDDGLPGIARQKTGVNALAPGNDEIERSAMRSDVVGDRAYFAGPANSTRLPSGSCTMKSFAPQGSCLSG